MLKTLITLSATTLLTVAAHGQTPSQTDNDRLEALCAVSDFDLVGKRLARKCRAQVRA